MSDRLEAALVELVTIAEERGIQLILAGGLGVVLRVRLSQVLQKPTLALVPAARTTRDLDVLLHPAVVVDAHQMEALRDVMDSLGYSVLESARHYQFVRGEAEAVVKVDFHVETPSNTEGLKITQRRVRPHGFDRLHAHATDEAVGSSLAPVSVPLLVGRGVVPESTDGATLVLTPNSFTFLAMKLLAFRDRLQASRADGEAAGREYAEADRHAFDMFAIWASTNEQMWEAAVQVRSETEGLKPRADLAAAARELFGDADSLGHLRLRQSLRDHGHEPDDGDVERFVSAVLELFASPS